MSSESPSDSLTDLVTYVVKLYAPVWFQIKVFWACSEGARHVWQLIKYSRYLKPELRSIVDEVVQWLFLSLTELAAGHGNGFKTSHQRTGL